MSRAIRRFLLLSTFLSPLVALPAEVAPRHAQEAAALAAIEIKPGQLAPVRTQTPIVENGTARATICHPDDPAWRAIGADIQRAIAGVTGVTLYLKTDAAMAPEQLRTQNTILLGNLNNNRLVARLYHNFFVCSDDGFTGNSGYEMRTVHDPFASGVNCILIGAKSADGARRGAQKLIDKIRTEGRRGSLQFGRLLELSFDPKDCDPPPPEPMDDASLARAVANGRKLMFSPGQARSGVARLVDFGMLAHRYGDPRGLKAYRSMMLALLEYYQKDEYVNDAGMRRYDRDFRDSWTHEVAILFDLLEESGAFSDQERLDLTNLIIRLGLECVHYQGWNKPATIASWAGNSKIVHNHNTFPALGVLFAGNYLKRHYEAAFADDWLKVARGIFNGQKHAWKPLEDSAGYQWLPIIHTMMYSLAEDDMAFFAEGHARRAADAAIQVMDCAGNQAAFGDYSALRGSSGLGATLQIAAWHHRDAGYAWGARLAGKDNWSPLGQVYAFAGPLVPPSNHVGLTVTRLQKTSYDTAGDHPTYPMKPNLPLEQTFDKLAFRGGWDRTDEYLLLDGFGRGNHMHFDANSIISFAKGGEPLLVDGEYIRNAPKYHNSLVIIRDGRSEHPPAVAGLDRADDLATAAVSLTRTHDWNGADWKRTILWRRNDYTLVADEVTAIKAGAFTLRCCWRPWGHMRAEKQRLLVDHPPMRLAMINVDGSPTRLKTLKTLEEMPVGRWSQQVSRDMKTNDTHRFINVFHADPADKPRQLDAHRLADGLVLVSRPGADDLVALAPGLQHIPGASAKAAVLLLNPEVVVLVDGTELLANDEILKASGPISIEISPPRGEGVITASGPAKISLRIRANGHLTVGQDKFTANGEGRVTFQCEPGRHRLQFDPFPTHAGIAAALDVARKMERQPAATPRDKLDGPRLQRAWTFSGLDAPMEKLRVASCEAIPPPREPYGPAAKLFDGKYNGSTTSAMWPRGVGTSIRADLQEDAQITRVVLREWQMNRTWEIGERRLEISSDGFNNDVRLISAPFQKVGDESFGNNVNTLMAVAVGQKARQIRLTCSAARPDAVVYLAEVEIHGSRAEAVPRVTALASSHPVGDGTDRLIAATDQGQLLALGPDGERLWSFYDSERGPINAIACADIAGDHRAEIIYGGDPAKLGLLDGDGRQLWRAALPTYRGVRSDVMTLFTANVAGDARPEIISGCRSWQYLAHDRAGKMLWQTVIYAHSATVGCATDVDGDGSDEIFAGNAYYAAQMLDHVGKQLWRVSGIGPEMTAVLALPGNGAPFGRDIVFGVDNGELHCVDIKGKQRWRTNLGDRVTRIACADIDANGISEIICAAESASVFALSAADGRTIWRRPLPDGASDLSVSQHPSGPRICVAAGDAGLLLLDAKGSIMAIGEIPGRAESLAAFDNGVAVADSSASITAFAAP